MNFSQTVRTISTNDHFMYATGTDIVTMESERRRLTTLAGLKTLLSTREGELVAEMKRDEPDMARVIRLRGIIANIRGTLNSAQR